MKGAGTETWVSAKERSLRGGLAAEKDGQEDLPPNRCKEACVCPGRGGTQGQGEVQ